MSINLLWPLLLILGGAGVWWFLTYFQSPKPFFIMLYVVVAILFVLWLVAVLGPHLNVTV